MEKRENNMKKKIAYKGFNKNFLQNFLAFSIVVLFLSVVFTNIHLVIIKSIGYINILIGISGFILVTNIINIIHWAFKRAFKLILKCKCILIKEKMYDINRDCF